MGKFNINMEEIDMLIKYFQKIKEKNSNTIKV